MKYLIASIFFIFTFLTATAQKGELIVNSTIICEMCKDNIENGMAYIDGVKSTRVDVDNNTITVKYKAKKISEDEVKKAISNTGYAADDVAANPEAYEQLHSCCKKGGGCD